MSTTIVNHGQLTWTNILHPTAEDIQQLAGRYPTFHPLNLQDCLTELELPKLDHYDDYIFLVVQMPVWDEAERITRPAEVDIFVSQGVLVTSHRGELKPLNKLYAAVQIPGSPEAQCFASSEAGPFLYYLIDRLVDYCFPIVQHIGANLRQMEERLFQPDTRRLLHEIAILRRDIIAVRSILKSQINVIQALIKGQWHFINNDLDPYWDDISNHLLQLCNALDQDAEVIAGLSETIDTLASHRIDDVIRLLTLVTVITLPLTLLATVFGMNVVMPMSEHPALFYLILGVGVIFSIWLAWYLRRRRWM